MDKNNVNQTNITIPSTEIRTIMDKIKELTCVPNSELSDNRSHLAAILDSLICGTISTNEKNKLLSCIIINQLQKPGSRYLTGIKYRGLGNHCTRCNGLGFQVIMETDIKVYPCVGDKSKNVLPCNGTGIKTSICNRCNGLKLSDILNIRNGILMGTDNTVKFKHFGKIKIDTISERFIEKNSEKTFRVIMSDEEINGESGGIYYYIPKSPCRTCGGTGFFVHDRKNIKCTCGGHNDGCEVCDGTGYVNGNPVKCPGCHGKGYKSKNLVTTGNVKSFLECSYCKGYGANIPSNPVINLKVMDENTKMNLQNSGLLTK